MNRVPACPSCHEPGIWVKGEFFRCSDRECGAVWLERGWQNRLEDEEYMKMEMERLKQLNVVVSIGYLRCDKCGKGINPGEKYIVNARQKSVFTTDAMLFHADTKRYERICVNCAVKSIYLKLIEEKSTGTRFLARGTIHPGEVEVPLSRGVYTPSLRKRIPEFGRYCQVCGEPTVALHIDKGSIVHIQCSNWKCSKYRNTQEVIHVDIESDLKKLPDGQYGQHCDSCTVPMTTYKDCTNYKQLLKCDNWLCNRFAIPQGIVK